MKNFKKREHVVADKVAGRVAGFIIKIQTAFAGVMNRMVKDRSINTIKWFLLIFLLSGTILSISVAAGAFTKKRISKINITHLHVTPVNTDASTSRVFILKSEYRQLQRYERYMDSLKKANPKFCDSIMKLRPGLLDSIKLLETFYKDQFQNQK